MTTFGWDLCHRCNYQCPYCGVWKEEPEKDLILSAARWKGIWDRMYERYGTCKIYVSGGEPSVYPGFYELVRALCEKHRPEICTNLSWEVARLVPLLSPEQLRIAPTFHPSFADFEEFLQKAVRVREYLPDGQIYYVAYPRHIKEMPERSRRLKDCGIKLIPLPLRGDGFVVNSEEEKKIIESVSPYRGSEKLEYQLNTLSPKGKPCNAGHQYAVIRSDGTVDRCSQYHTGEVGTIFDDAFALKPGPVPCTRDYCPIESQWIVTDA